MKCLWWNCDEVATSPTGFCSSSCGNCYRVDLRRREMRWRLVQMHGGRCARCGYSKCIDALEFHHRDPTTKSFSIASGLTPAFEVLLKEAQKCDLVCANCHREEEASPFAMRWLVVIERVKSREVLSYGSRIDPVPAMQRVRGRCAVSGKENRVKVRAAGRAHAATKKKAA